MSQNFKFFQNNKCEYFPCHKVKEESTFNCLFCFCPLYMLAGDCGGNFKYSGDVKDCSDCLLPHGENSYAFVMNKMDMVIQKGSERD